MRLVHEPADGERTTLATTVETMDTFLRRARGLRFRREFPEGTALVFQFGRPGLQTLDMLFVPFPIDALWLVDGEVRKVERLAAWRGVGVGRADVVVELPADAAGAVEVGDAVWLDREPRGVAGSSGEPGDGAGARRQPGDGAGSGREPGGATGSGREARDGS